MKSLRIYFIISVITIMLAFLLPAHIVSKNYYYFANNSHLRVQFFGDIPTKLFR